MFGPASGAEILTDFAPLVGTLSYKPGWSFKIGGPGNRSLCVFATTPNSLHPATPRTTQHMLEMPAAPCTVAGFLRWLLGRLALVEAHETAEFLRLDGFAPFWPHHQDEGSPYEHVERWSTP